MVLTCICGAVCKEAKDKNRFLKRHSTCEAKKKLAQKLGAGVRCVTFDEAEEISPEVYQMIKERFGNG